MVLDLDPDLAAGIDLQERDAARRGCVGELVHVRPGRWEYAALMHDGALIALIVVEGIICREVGLRNRRMLEFLGPGDVFALPAVEDGVPAGAAPERSTTMNGTPLIGADVIFTAAATTVLVALREEFLRAAARWPQLMLSVVRRLETQRASLAVQGLIGHLSRAEHRVLLVLWHLGQRWGRVTPEGIVVPLALTHDILGQLTGAQRSTATLAVRHLEGQRLVARLDDGSWLLTAAAEGLTAAIVRATSRTPVLGETFRVRQRISEVRAQSRALGGRGAAG